MMAGSGYPPRTRAIHWVLASCLLGLVGFSAFLILGVCGVLSPLSTWGLSVCPAVASDASDSRLEAALGRQAVLEAQVSDLEVRLARLECHPPEPPPPPPPPAPEPEPEPEPEPVGGMDAEQWEEQDIQMLEGCWALDSNYRLRDKDTGAISTVSSWNMCFDANGIGNQTLRFDDGTTCRSGTSARFNSVGQLEIRDDANVHCSDQSYIYKRIMTCDHQSDGTASCQSTQPELGSRSTEVRIRSR